MTIEPCDLIKISLGKILTSRYQKGGIRLHKNLLVANLILNTRSLFINDLSIKEHNNTDIVNSNLREEESAECDLSMDNSNFIIDKMDNETMPVLLNYDKMISTSQLFNSNNNNHLLKENKLFKKLKHDEDFINDDDNTNVHIDISENQTFNKNHEIKNVDSTNYSFYWSCQNSNKRKLKSEIESDDAECDTHSNSKRLCYSTLQSVPSLSDDELSNELPEPLQDCFQLNKVEHDIQLGFTGLFIDINSNISQFDYESKHCINNDDLCIDNLNSCSAHIREALDTLTKPLISLSV